MLSKKNKLKKKKKSTSTHEPKDSRLSLKATIKTYRYLSEDEVDGEEGRG